MKYKKFELTAKLSLFYKKTFTYKLPDYEYQLFADEQAQQRNLKFWSLKRNTFKYTASPIF